MDSRNSPKLNRPKQALHKQPSDTCTTPVDSSSVGRLPKETSARDRCDIAKKYYIPTSNAIVFE